MPSWLVVAAAVAMSLPFGWGLGVLAAYLIGGKDFGQLPVATVPVGLIVAITFALWPSFKPRTRLIVMVGGSAVFFFLAWFIP